MGWLVVMPWLNVHSLREDWALGRPTVVAVAAVGHQTHHLSAPRMVGRKGGSGHGQRHPGSAIRVRTPASIAV